MTYSNVIADRMARKGYSAAKVAAALNVSPSAVYSWKAGTKKPSRDNWVRLVRILGVTRAEQRAIDESYSPPSRPLVVLSSGERVGDSPKEQT